MSSKTGSFNGLNFGPGTQIRVADVGGWIDMPGIRARDTARVADHGVSSAPDLANGRTVQLELWLSGSDPTDLEALRQTVRNAFPITENVLPLVINDQQVFAKVRRRDIEDDLSAAWRTGKAKIEFFCPDSKVYSAGENTQSIGLATSASGLVIPWVLPISLGAGPTGGQIVVNNAGNAPAALKITYSGGQLVNPGSTQVETGRRLKMSMTVQSSETLLLDTGAHTVLLNGNTSRRSSLTVDQWFTLPPGNSTITFTADASTGTPQMQLKWRSTWI